MVQANPLEIRSDSTPNSSEDDEEQKECDLAVMREMLKIHGKPPCEDYESAKRQVEQLIRENYETQSKFEQLINQAIERVYDLSRKSGQVGFVPNKYGILRLARSAMSQFAYSDDKMQRERRRAVVQQYKEMHFRSVVEARKALSGE